MKRKPASDAEVGATSAAFSTAFRLVERWASHLLSVDLRCARPALQAMPERAGRQRSCLVYLLAALCLTASSLSRSDLIPSRHRHHRLEQLCPTPEPFAALMGDQGRNGYRFLKAEASASRGPKTYKYRAEAPGGSLLTWQQALQLWQQQDSGFAEDFAAELRSSEFKAFFFETPPLTPRNLGDIFEFVLADSPKLAQVWTAPTPRNSSRLSLSACALPLFSYRPRAPSGHQARHWGL